MKAEATHLDGCFIFTPKIISDPRGYFYESFNQKVFNDVIGESISFVQDNQSKSSYGVLRGLHFQLGEFAQAKLVRVLEGEVLDVAVDLRKGSETYGEHISVVLSGDNYKQLFVPRGFAHGFVVLSSSAIFSYKCDNFYAPKSESGIIYNDVDLDIDWKLPDSEILLSEKDSILQNFKDYNPD